MRSRPTYWDKVKAELRPKFSGVGLLHVCEFALMNSPYKSKNCTKNKYLTFAHSLRRRKIDKFKKDNDETMYEKKMREVIRICQVCHQDLDAMEHEETERIVLETIKNRLKPIV